MILSKREAMVLDLLIDGREMYGLEIVNESKGKLKLGTLYVTLNRLEEKGFAISRRETEPTFVVPRRLYKITGTGAQAYRTWVDSQAHYHSRLCGAEYE